MKTHCLVMLCAGILLAGTATGQENLKPYPVPAGRDITVNFGTYRAKVDPAGAIRQVFLADGTRVFWEGRLYGHMLKSDTADFPGGRIRQNSEDEQKQTPITVFTAREALIVERESTMGMPDKGAPNLVSYKQRVVFWANGLISVHYEITYLEERAKWTLPCFYLMELPMEVFPGKPYTVMNAKKEVVKKGNYPATAEEIKLGGGSGCGQEITFQFPGTAYRFTAGPQCDLSLQDRRTPTKSRPRLRMDARPSKSPGWVYNSTMSKGTKMILDFSIELPVTGKGTDPLVK